MTRDHVSRETADKLSAFRSLLRKWNRSVRLVGTANIDEFVIRSQSSLGPLESLLLRTRCWVDVGSGNGVPLVPMVLRSLDLGLRVNWHAIESDARKASFLVEVKRVLDLPIEVHRARVEDCQGISPDVVSAQALGSVASIFSVCPVAWRDSAQFCLFKGGRVHDEVENAAFLWTSRYKLRYDPSGRRGYILFVESLHHA